MCFRHYPAVLGLSLAFISCSVLEDREPCPCFVTLDYTMVANPDAGTDSLYVVMPGEGTMDICSRHTLDILPEKEYFEIPKAASALSCFCAPADKWIPDRGYAIPAGEQCPPVYAWACDFGTVPEICAQVRLHKQYAALSLRVTGLGASRFRFAIVGFVSGFDLHWKPSPGPFCVMLAPDANGRCRVNVPRQPDSSLLLCQYQDGELVRSLSLGEYIRRLGYDWSAPDLEDIDVEIMCNESALSFKISQWNRSQSITIVF